MTPLPEAVSNGLNYFNVPYWLNRIHVYITCPSFVCILPPHPPANNKYMHYPNKFLDSIVHSFFDAQSVKYKKQDDYSSC